MTIFKMYGFPPLGVRLSLYSGVPYRAYTVHGSALRLPYTETARGLTWSHAWSAFLRRVSRLSCVFRDSYGMCPSSNDQILSYKATACLTSPPSTSFTASLCTSRLALAISHMPNVKLKPSACAHKQNDTITREAPGWTGRLTG